MEKTYCVYMHTLKIDGRKYIGVTGQEPARRWRPNGAGYKLQSYFWNAIQKYGWDNFKHEILFEELAWEQASLKEQALIKLFNTTDHKFGFNLTLGGEHYEFSETALKKMKDSHTIYNVDEIQLVQLYSDENKTVREISEFLEVPVGAIRTKLHRLGIKKTKEQIKNITKKSDKGCYTKSKYSSYDPQVTQLYMNENKPARVVAQTLGIPTSAVWSRVTALGLHKTDSQIKEVRTRSYSSKYSQDLDEQIIYLYTVKNQTRKEIANFLNVSFDYIRHRIQKLGLKKTTEQRAKIQSKTCIKKYNNIKLKCIELNLVFTSTTEIYNYFGSYDHIHEVIYGTRHGSFGYHWEVIEQINLEVNS